MKKHLLSLVVGIILFAGCSGDPKTQAVEAAYRDFSRAVLAGDADGIYQAAPFLADVPTQTRRAILADLRSIFQRNPTPSIRFQAPDYALVRLDDPRKTVIPFARSAADVWLVSDRIVQTETIDFIGAE